MSRAIRVSASSLNILAFSPTFPDNLSNERRSGTFILCYCTTPFLQPRLREYGNLFKILLDAADKALFSFSIEDRFEVHVHPEVEEEIEFITAAGYGNQDHEIFQSHAFRICSGVQLQNKDNDAKNCGHNQFEDVKKFSLNFRQFY
jgi:hypothetical protein